MSSASDCFAIHMTNSDSSSPLADLTKKVYMQITVVNVPSGGDPEVTYTTQLTSWGNLGNDKSVPPYSGALTLVNTSPPNIPGSPEIPWTDVTALWGIGTQPTEAPFDNVTSTVTISLWQEG